MPAIYTHYAIAHRLFNNLSHALQKEIRPYLPLYYFGSQGADFCFFYRVLGEKTPNLGSYLHRAGGYEAFRVLQAFSSRSKVLFAYAIGYITHYAADVTFHPYVYAMAGKSYPQHSRLEGALDIYFKPRLQNLAQENLFRKPSRDEETELYILYATIAAKAGMPPLMKNVFSRAITLFNAYPPISSAVFAHENERYLRYAVNEEKRPWRYPTDKSILRNDNADELFEKSLVFCQSLVDEFLFRLENKTRLPATLFGKNYLTGL